MKTIFRPNYHSRILVLAILVFSCVCAPAQGSEPEGYVKKGWSVVPIPSLAYDSDLGLQLGAIVETYYFGDGSTYPEYMHKLSAQASYFTKGSGIFHLFYDSGYLLRDKRLTASVSYLPNRMMSFYGFNGYYSPWLGDEDGAYYFVDRNLFRAMGDVQGKISGNVGWALGAAFFNYNTGRVRLDKYAAQTTLYDIYLREGVIDAAESRGGSHVEFRAGLVYDTRDHEPDPTRGIHADVILYGSPDVFNAHHKYGYMKAAAAFRHYVPLWGKRLTLAYRLCYQGTLAGDPPFYVQQNYTTLFLRQINSDILGGSISLRGVAYNRVVSNGVGWANVELRLRTGSFRLMGQEWYLALNPFFDLGMSVQPYRLERMKQTGDERIYDPRGERLHTSAGLGGKIIMNNNFVLSAEYGRPLDRRDGSGGIYLNVNYLF